MDANEFFRGCLLPAYRHGLGVERMACEPDAGGRLRGGGRGPYRGLGHGAAACRFRRGRCASCWPRRRPSLPHGPGCDAGELPKGWRSPWRSMAAGSGRNRPWRSTCCWRPQGNDERLVDAGDLPRFETVSP